MYTITFRAEGGMSTKISSAPGENILHAAIQAGAVIDAPCSGNGTCGKCLVRLISGTVDSTHNIHLSDYDFDDGWRLACQCTVSGDATLLIPESAAAFKTGIRTADLSSKEELQKYMDSISAIFSCGISPGVQQSGTGLAIDIGTTTVTGALINLESGTILSKASAGNGQIRYGADVINRIIHSSRDGGREKLRRAVTEDTLIPLINTMCEIGGISSTDINRVVVAGNTTMEHLFMGIDAESIRLEPYIPAFLELHGQTGADAKLPIAPDAPLILAPNVGSYVGGDISAGVLTTLLWNKSDLTLFIDLGTNGELVLGNRDFMLCCACSAGPAFEGGDISCGMRATNGAIEGCAIDFDTMEPTLEIVGENEKAAGLCGSGIIDTISELFRCGIIDSRGKFARDGTRIVRDEYEASYVLAFADESATGKNVEIKEVDIDNFIRAKGAIFSAIRAMLNVLDMEVDMIDSVLVAGGIGSGINIKSAIGIGMLPAIDESKYEYIGNSSLTGACAMLISQEAEEKVYRLSRNMTYLELSSHPGYMDEFVAACFLPHTDASLFE